MGLSLSDFTDPFNDALDWATDQVDSIVDSASDIIDAFVDSAGNLLEDVWKEVAVPIMEFVFGLLGFTDETIYSTQVITLRLIPDVQKDSLVLSILKAIRENESIVDNIKSIILTNVVGSVKQYVNYGQNGYIYNIPEVISSWQLLDPGAIKTVIDSIEGESVTITKSFLNYADDLYWVKYYLQENENYSEKDNIIILTTTNWLYSSYTKDSITNTFVVNLSRVITTTVDVTTVTTIDTVGTTETTTVEVTTVTTIDNGTPSETTITTVVDTTITTQTTDGSGINDGVTTVVDPSVITTITEYTTLGYEIPATNIYIYYNVAYTLDSDPTFTKYWLYQRSLGTYPTLDRGALPSNDTNFMLPIVPIRIDGVSVNNNTSSNEYITSKKLLNTVGLSIDDTIIEIEKNTAIANIENVFILFGINLYTTSVPGIDYLYKFFHGLYINATVTKTDYDARNPVTEDPVFNTVMITEQNYNIAITYNYITNTDVVGVIGDILTVTKEIFILPNTSAASGGGVNSYILFKFQYNATNYAELKVHGLFQSTMITATANEIKTTLSELSIVQEEMDNFIIPLSSTIIYSFSPNEQEVLIYESLQIVIYAMDSVDLAWYETSSFLFFMEFAMIVVSVILIFVTFGTYSSVASFFYALFEQLLYQYALNYIFTYILENYASNEIQRLLAVFAYAAAAYYGGKSISNMGTAEALLFGVQAMTQAISIDLEVQMNLLQYEIDSWTIDAEERQEELDKARDMLDNSSGLDYFSMGAYLPVNPNETPSDFYERTIHTGNPGVLSITEIENFIENQLKLPELDTYFV